MPCGFLFRLVTVEGEPAEPPTHSGAVSNIKPGDEIPLGRRSLRVIDRRDDDADQPPVLVVEYVPERPQMCDLEPGTSPL